MTTNAKTRSNCKLNFITILKKSLSHFFYFISKVTEFTNVEFRKDRFIVNRES